MRPKMSTTKRAFIERRSGKDRRRKFHIGRFFYRGPEMRGSKERRAIEERRNDWVKISKWSSVPLWELKISKFLKKPA
jgi:hypothetical protein